MADEHGDVGSKDESFSGDNGDNARDVTNATQVAAKDDARAKAANEQMTKSLALASDADGDGDTDVLDLHYLDWRELLYDFYENYQESQLDEVDEILFTFRGREVELFEALGHKYIHAPFGVYTSKARKLKRKELKELDKLVYRADMVYEPAYTGVCRQPIRLVDELNFRKHMIAKFDDQLGGWQRLAPEQGGSAHASKTGMVYYNQVWDEDSKPKSQLPPYRKGAEKRTWEIIHAYAPYHYDIDDNERYHEVLDMSYLMANYAQTSGDKAALVSTINSLFSSGNATAQGQSEAAKIEEGNGGPLSMSRSTVVTDVKESHADLTSPISGISV